MLVDQLFISDKKRIASKSNERWSRSFLKSVSWRIIGTLDTIIISYVITSEISFALSIGLSLIHI